jgi:exopolyphosphatase / guanosine-5'-triphosphate,3'-diphosphate pyrophosphatase
MTRVAVVDCGTNSTRLLIVDESGGQVARELRTTRLGEGVHASRVLGEAAIERTLRALGEYRLLIDRFGATRVRAVATSATRDASNHEDFFVRAGEVLGVRPELISGEEEGRLTFAGATADLEGRPCLVIDIGGGSTEFVTASASHSPTSLSIDIGSVRISEQALKGDPYSRDELHAAERIIGEMLDDVLRTVGVAGDRMLVGVAGTISSLAAIDLGITGYQQERLHGHVLTRQRVTQIVDRLASMTLSERCALPSMPQDRAEILVGGGMILRVAMEILDFVSCRVSQLDILDGMAKSLRES